MVLFGHFYLYALEFTVELLELAVAFPDILSTNTLFSHAANDQTDDIFEQGKFSVFGT